MISSRTKRSSHRMEARPKTKAKASCLSTTISKSNFSVSILSLIEPLKMPLIQLKDQNIRQAPPAIRRQIQVQAATQPNALPTPSPFQVTNTLGAATECPTPTWPRTSWVVSRTAQASQARTTLATESQNRVTTPTTLRTWTSSSKILKKASPRWPASSLAWLQMLWVLSKLVWIQFSSLFFAFPLYFQAPNNSHSRFTALTNSHFSCCLFWRENSWPRK